MDKGGCKIGKKSDKGGCKVGKKKVFKVRNPKKPTEKAKPKMEEKAKPKRKFNVKNPGKPIVIKPKVEEKPKPKKKINLVVKKKLVGTLKPSDILKDEYLYRAEENVQETMSYVDFDWIKGISMKDVEFYRKHFRDFDSISEKKRDRIERIEEKVNDNLRPSLKKEMLKNIKSWITNNKDENMTLSQARKKWADTYF